jgi:hypothetical protein
VFKKSIEAIIAEGQKNLVELIRQTEVAALRAKDEVKRCSDEISGLVALSKDVPEKIFDRYSTVLTAVGQIYGNSPGYHSIRISGSDLQLRGLMGDESVKPGNYRILVLVEPIS